MAGIDLAQLLLVGNNLLQVTLGALSHSEISAESNSGCKLPAKAPLLLARMVPCRESVCFTETDVGAEAQRHSPQRPVILPLQSTTGDTSLCSLPLTGVAPSVESA